MLVVEADYADTVRDSIRRYSASPALAELLLAGAGDDNDYDDPEPISDASAGPRKSVQLVLEPGCD
ncbi:hypothetical protein ERC79_13445 [Rhodococcus sp. ABRD24]|uniref:hypothetical protein n=1 Tax=Rhodococcus sp. ABRD24 TaxID=2507582 RepID=UPI00103AB05B|nr:hypothetical protein [Rhodococcus sp. ABRD24]QBJ96844.1 hypothetical protein ERC79_13445 [Rhodococcus sp. ABRD24]